MQIIRLTNALRHLCFYVLLSVCLAFPAYGQGANGQAAQSSSLNVQTTLKLVAVYRPEGPIIDGKLTWRVFEAEPGPDGNYKLVVRSSDPSPIFVLNVGSYLVHASMGYARNTQVVQLGEQPQILRLILPAGGLQLSSNIGQKGDDRRVKYDILDTDLDEFGERKVLIKDAPVNTIIPLSEGAYQIVSRFGDANAEIREDVVITAAQLTSVHMEHKAASITFKLVSETGGEALADTSWTILDASGEKVQEGVGAFPTYILAEGEYSVIAAHNNESFSREFDVSAGEDKEIELLAENPAQKN